MPSCSRRRPRHCAPSPPIRGIWAPRSASSQCSTHASQTLTHHPPSPLRRAGRRIAPDGRAGSPAARISSCPSTCSRASIDACSSTACKQRSTPGAALLRRHGAVGRGPSIRSADQAPAQDRWVVYAKPPFGSTDQVLAYLGRYTHRVAIADSRLVAIDETRAVPLARLSTGEPKQADDARASEFSAASCSTACPTDSTASVTTALANGHRQSKLALIRRLLDQPAPLPTRRSEDYRERVRELTGVDLSRCPCCGGAMRVIDILPCTRAPPIRPASSHAP